MALQSSGEMYLESIYVLSRQKSYVRAIDIAEYMDFSKPSVSRAVAHLKQEEYITVDAQGHITLTDSGLAVAQKIFERHTVLSRCLQMLGVNAQTAAEDACRIEHVISDESFMAIKQHIEKLQ